MTIFLLGGYAIVIRNDAAAKQTQEQMQGVREELKNLAIVITKQAVQDERLNEQARRMGALESRLEELRRGEGYIQERHVKTVDREY